MKFKINPVSISILLFNLVPIAGVAFYGWSPFEMFWLFWMETLIIAFFNAIRIIYSQGYLKTSEMIDGEMKYNLYPAFKYLVGRILVFLFYSIFIIVFIGIIAHKKESALDVFGTILFQNRLFNLALLISVCSQTYFIVKFFFMNGAYHYSMPGEYSAIFDGRQIVMHVAVVLGAVGAAFLFKDSKNETYASIWIIAVFCICKCIFELYFNNRAGKQTSASL